MKSHLIVDISGKVPYYEHALCTALEQENKDRIILATPYNQSIYSPSYKVRGLVCITYGNNLGSRKILKAIEGILNYFVILFDLLYNKYNIVHFQWLPFLEFWGGERFFMALYRKVSPETKFILTQHNIFPHNSPIQKKNKYRKRFSKVEKYFDKFVVHTNSSKLLFHEEFGVSLERIEVIYHGIFTPQIMPSKKINNKKMKFLMFGIQSYYKGTDIFVDAISGLSKDIRDCIEVVIVGKTETKLLQEKYDLASSLGIRWESRFLEDEELNQHIVDSDVLVFPYRSISQSGALLLALAFGKPMIVSKLPSFIETLEGFPNSVFVNPGSVESLQEVIINHVNGAINISEELMSINLLLQKYSWENSAKKTLALYDSICVINENSD